MTLIDWHFLHIYKDVIVNGLDLLSFILVTPQIVRAFATRSVLGAAMGSMALPWLAFVLLAPLSVVAIVIVTLLGIDASQITDRMPYVFGLYIVSSAGIALITYLIGYTFEHYEPYALAVGIMVFFLSRIVALAIAIHEAHASACCSERMIG